MANIAATCQRPTESHVDGTPARDPAARLTQLWTTMHIRPHGAVASPQRVYDICMGGRMGGWGV